MRSVKLANLLFISAFLVFIFLVTTVTIVREKLEISELEYRTLARQPALDVRLMSDPGYFSSWETFFTDHAAGRTTLVRLGAQIDLNIIKRPVVNDIFSSGDLLLGFNDYETVIPWQIQSDVAVVVNEIALLNDVISSYGGSLYYVSVPAHYAWYADEYPWYLNNREEYTRLSMEAFSSSMSDAGLNHIHLMEVLAGLDSEHLLYSLTDHHYTFRGAYETYREIVERVNSDGKFFLPLTVEGVDFEFRRLGNPFMGSRIRRILGIPGYYERVEIAKLYEDIPFTRTDEGRPWERPAVFSHPFNDWDVLHYGVYMGGDIPETVIDTGRDYLPNVLIFGDSSTNAVECFMYASSGEFRSLDLRLYDDMSLAEYVLLHKPDIVIGIRGYGVLLEFSGNGVLMS